MLKMITIWHQRQILCVVINTFLFGSKASSPPATTRQSSRAPAIRPALGRCLVTLHITKTVSRFCSQCPYRSWHLPFYPYTQLSEREPLWPSLFCCCEICDFCFKSWHIWSHLKYFWHFTTLGKAPLGQAFSDAFPKCYIVSITFSWNGVVNTSQKSE